MNQSKVVVVKLAFISSINRTQSSKPDKPGNGGGGSNSSYGFYRLFKNQNQYATSHSKYTRHFAIIVNLRQSFFYADERNKGKRVNASQSFKDGGRGIQQSNRKMHWLGLAKKQKL